MKKLHIHMNTKDLEKSIAFYTAMFGTPPTKIRDDYAKWGLDDPSINFALSQVGGCGREGIGHLGIETDTAEALSAHIETIQAVDTDIDASHKVECCYASSDKTWATDPSGVQWENFYSFGDSNTLQPIPIDTPAETETSSHNCC